MLSASNRSKLCLDNVEIDDPWKTTTKRWESKSYCQWTSRALKVALTPKNIKVDFRSIKIWPLDCTAAMHAMNVAVGFRTNTEDQAGMEHCGRLTEPAGYHGTAIE